jgi:hypothetical protein
LRQPPFLHWSFEVGNGGASTTTRSRHPAVQPGLPPIEVSDHDPTTDPLPPELDDDAA